MSKTAQNFNNGQYVNYINGIPVTELSPEMNKKGKFLNQKLPKIQKKIQDRTPGTTTAQNNKKTNFILRNSVQLGSIGKRASRSNFHSQQAT